MKTCAIKKINQDFDIDKFLDNLFLAEEKIKRQKKISNEFSKISSTLVREAVKHFKTKHFRSEDENDFDERYLFTQKEVEEFVKLNKNPAVKIRYVEDKIDGFLYYELYR